MTEQRKKYYAVTCKCGHTDSKKLYIPITFGIIASNAKEAARIGRWLPRSKHHHKDCVLSVKEISCKQYKDLRIKNNKDPYLNCHSIQEQRMFDFSGRFVRENEKKKTYKRDKEVSTYMCGKKRIKHPKQYMKNIYRSMEERSY